METKKTEPATRGRASAAEDGAIFLDRDGVINEDVWPTPLKWAHVKFLPGSLAAIADLSAHGWRVFIVTNKTAMGWRILSAAANDEINGKILDAIHAAGGTIEKLYFCGHHPWSGCACRKPKPGMLENARREFGVDPAKSWMVGDQVRDVLAGKAFGARTARIAGSVERKAALSRESGAPRADVIAIDLAEAVRAILAASPERAHPSGAEPNGSSRGARSPTR